MECPIDRTGAEAEITDTVFLGRAAVKKTRPPKGYRLPELDARIRTSRTKNEARILRETRSAGVRTPCIYDVDLKNCSMTMERLDGDTVKDRLDLHPEEAPDICVRIGRAVAAIHSAGITHGDLTTSNMMICGDGICFIDMSMGKTRAELEDIGIDLRLLERAFSSAHPGLEEAFGMLMREYYANVPDPKATMKKLDDIRNRGRYT